MRQSDPDDTSGWKWFLTICAICLLWVIIVTAGIWASAQWHEPDGPIVEVPRQDTPRP